MMVAAGGILFWLRVGHAVQVHRRGASSSQRWFDILVRLLALGEKDMDALLYFKFFNCMH